MSIGSNGQLKCPSDICMSNGSVGSNGPLDILPLPSHRPATCMGSMPTYDVFRDNLLNEQPNFEFQWTYACSLDPMDKIKCPLDISMSIGSNGQLKCPLDILHVQWIHWIQWTFSLCHLTGLLPAWGRCQPMTSFK